MLFTTASYFFFFAVVTFAYFLLPSMKRWLVLLAASLYFYYSFVPQYLPIILAIIGMDYLVARFMETTEERNRKLLLIFGITVNVAMLVIFKYLGFFNQNLENLAQLIGWNYSLDILHLALPIGLSFHTFQSISYLIEVYRRQQLPEKNLAYYALYVIFFPQMIAGPIERPQQMLPQIAKPHFYDEARVTEGLLRIVEGLFKKMIIADNLSLVVNQVYAQPTEFSGFWLLLATLAFAFQIYYDFSGYCDIALGCAKILGFTLVENFNAPYFARNISDFWRRWHISLSSWFRDYVYIPLGGNRVSSLKVIRNIVIVFFLSGLWHGANWTFIVWGLLHAAALVVLIYWQKLTRTLPAIGLPDIVTSAAGIAVTFIFVVLTWILFRADTLSNAWYILTHLLPDFGTLFREIDELDILSFRSFPAPLGTLGLSYNYLTIAGWGVILTTLYTFLKRARFAIYLQAGIAFIFVLAILNFGVLEEIPFVYFRF